MLDRCDREVLPGSAWLVGDHRLPRPRVPMRIVVKAGAQEVFGIQWMVIKAVEVPMGEVKQVRSTVVKVVEVPVGGVMGGPAWGEVEESQLGQMTAPRTCAFESELASPMHPCDDDEGWRSFALHASAFLPIVCAVGPRM